MGDLLGYMRVSTSEQELEPQRQRLDKVGTIKNFEDVISGRKFERPGLKALFDYARPGDIPVVVGLDRLGQEIWRAIQQ